MEHITVSPEKVRMGGNIIDKKEIDDYESDDADLSVTTEVINLEEENVFLVSTDMVPASVVLSTDKTYLSYLMRYSQEDRYATLTAKVLDSYDNPIHDETVTIYNGETVLATGVTDAQGEFSYNYVTAHLGDMNLVAVCGSVSSNVVVVHDYYWADMADKDLSEYYKPVVLIGHNSPTLTYDSSTNTYVMAMISGLALFTLRDYVKGDVVVEADLTPYSIYACAVGAGYNGAQFNLGYGFGLGIMKGNYAIGWQYEEDSFTNLYGENQPISWTGGLLHVEFIIQGRDITTTYTQNGEVIFTKTCRVEETLDASDGNYYGIMTNRSVTFKNFIVKPYIPEPSPVDNVTLASDKSVLSAFDSEVATLTASVTNSQSAPVTGETVIFYKGSTVLGTATTNSSGVATVSYSAVGAGELTFTAEAEGITSTSITLQDCYRYDNCSSDKSSSYTPLQISQTGVVQSFSFSTDHYVLSSSTDTFTGFEVYNVNDNVELSLEFKASGTSAFIQALVGYYDGTTTWYGVRARGDKKVEYYQRNYNNTGDVESTFYTHSSFFNTEYYRLKMRKAGTSLKLSIETLDGTELGSTSKTITYSASDKIFFGFLSGNNRDILVKKIKVKQITGA